jgi:DNA (cytosine-5)-methyltransferase 1
MRYVSVCAGIEAATVAWHPLGWTPLAFSDIDPFACAVLAHHYPSVPNWGDLTRFQEWPDATVDLLVGGTPCQSFSAAGLRAGLADPRGHLALAFLAVVDRYRPRWVVWENVPGVLSADSHDSPDPCPPTDDVDEGAERVVEDEYDADESHAFACLLAGFSDLGYFGAYGTLDAQYAGLAQRRKRVFAVFHSGEWQRAAAVLFDRTSLSGHPAPRRETGQAVTADTLRSTDGGSDVDHGAAGHLNGFDASEDGTGRGTSLVTESYTLAIRGRGDSHDLEYRQDGIANAVLTPNGGRGGIGVGAVAFDARQSNVIQYGNLSGPLDTNGASIAVAFAENQRAEPGQGYPAVMQHMAVRRLTPLECERLQGFPDGYTAIPYRGKLAADGPRYKALGNSMAVPVMRWIGSRIALVEQACVEATCTR